MSDSAPQPDTEARTHYSGELHHLFDDAGSYRMYVPRRYGGHEVDVPTVVRVMTALGRGSMQAAWGLGLARTHDWRCVT